MTDDVAPASPADVAPPSEAPSAVPTERAVGERDAIDLDAIERDLDGVEAALTRLADGTYRTDEVTGAPLTDELLARDPIARRA